jgi:hypothetical protein
MPRSTGTRISHAGRYALCAFTGFQPPVVAAVLGLRNVITALPTAGLVERSGVAPKAVDCQPTA